MKCSELRRLVLGVLEEKTQEAPSDTASVSAQASAVSAGESVDRELGALETAIRTLVPLALRLDTSATDLDGLSLTWEAEFPLPSALIPATVYLTGYLLGGDSRLNKLYGDECATIRSMIPAEIASTAQVYKG